MAMHAQKFLEHYAAQASLGKGNAAVVKYAAAGSCNDGSSGEAPAAPPAAENSAPFSPVLGVLQQELPKPHLCLAYALVLAHPPEGYH
jgi:hypothetical protein